MGASNEAGKAGSPTFRYTKEMIKQL